MASPKISRSPIVVQRSWAIVTYTNKSLPYESSSSSSCSTSSSFKDGLRFFERLPTPAPLPFPEFFFDDFSGSAPPPPFAGSATSTLPPTLRSTRKSNTGEEHCQSCPFHSARRDSQTARTIRTGDRLGDVCSLERLSLGSLSNEIASTRELADKELACSAEDDGS